MKPFVKRGLVRKIIVLKFRLNHSPNFTPTWTKQSRSITSILGQNHWDLKGICFPMSPFSQRIISWIHQKLWWEILSWLVFCQQYSLFPHIFSAGQLVASICILFCHKDISKTTHSSLGQKERETCQPLLSKGLQLFCAKRNAKKKHCVPPQNLSFVKRS